MNPSRPLRAARAHSADVPLLRQARQVIALTAALWGLHAGSTGARRVHAPGACA